MNYDDYIKPWVILLTDGDEELRNLYPDNIVWTARDIDTFIDGIKWVEAVDAKGVIILDINEKFDYIFSWLRETNRDSGRFHVIMRPAESL